MALPKTDAAEVQDTFPSKGPNEFVAKVHDWWQAADQACSEWLQNEQSDHAFALGKQWDQADMDLLKEDGRVPLVINKTLPALLVVSGHERSNRMRVRYLPVEDRDTPTAETWSEVARVVQESGDIDFVKSECFMDSLKGGRGFMELRIDYQVDPKGAIVADRVLPWEIRVDPTSVRRDLSDARYILRAKDVSYEELLVLWPEKGEEIIGANLVALDLGTAATVGDRESDYDSLVSASYKKGLNTWQLIEVWYWQVENPSNYRALNQETGEWEPLKDQAHVDALKMIDPMLVYEHKPVYEKKYYHAFVVGPLELEHEPSPYEYAGFPYIPFFGLKDEDSGRYLGMVYQMRDPQMEVNKRRSQVLHILNRSAKGGWTGPEGAFGADKNEWEEESSKAGVVLEWVPNPAMPDGGKPAVITPPQLPIAFVELEKMAAVDLRDVSGINLELMGLSQKDTPGIVTSQRQRQALTILQTYFDGLRRSTKQLGRVMLSMMQQFYTDGRSAQITGKDGTPQAVQLGPEMKAGKYDLVAEEAPYSPNQKMETAMKLGEVIKTALQAKIPVPPDVLDYLDLPVSLTSKWKDMLAESQKAMSSGIGRIKEFIDLDKLFPLLSYGERAQILQQLGIKPDPPPMVPGMPPGMPGQPGPPMPPGVGGGPGAPPPGGGAVMPFGGPPMMPQ